MKLEPYNYNEPASSGLNDGVWNARAFSYQNIGYVLWSHYTGDRYYPQFERLEDGRYTGKQRTICKEDIEWHEIQTAASLWLISDFGLTFRDFANAMFDT